MGDSASQNLRRPERAYSPPHDTAQTRANWAGNPVASRSLDRCDAARACDARAKRRLYSPDDPPPSACESHTGHAGWSAPSEDRHHQGTSGCSAKQPDSPHPEQRTKCAPVEGLATRIGPVDQFEWRTPGATAQGGRAHHRESHPQWKREPRSRVPGEGRGPALFRQKRAKRTKPLRAKSGPRPSPAMRVERTRPTPLI